MKFNFPETEAEFIDWRYETRRVMLHREVMCLAKTRAEGKWCAYCFPVPGVNHDKEEYLWLDKGCKMAEKVARLLFPQFEDIKYAY